MVHDDVLATQANSECSPGSGALVMRAPNPVKTTPKADKLFESTFDVKVNKDGGTLQAFLGSGQWFDDGDGVAEDPNSSGDT